MHLNTSFVALLVFASASTITLAQSPRQVLATEAINARAWALAPLETAVPSSIRDNLTLLREALLDEGKAATPEAQESYKAGYGLSNLLIAAIDEHDQAAVRAGYRAAQAEANTRMTNQSLDAHAPYRSSWPQHARIREQRTEVQRQENNKSALAKEKVKLDWSNRVKVLQTGLDAAYMRYRQALRQDPGFVGMRNGESDLAKRAPDPVSAKKAPVPVSANGLVLHYDFAQEELGGKITDMSELGNDGKVTGAQWMSTKGGGGCYEFTAERNVIRPLNSDSLNCARITASVWIKTSCIDEYWRRVLLKSWDKGYGLCMIGDWRENKSCGVIRFYIGDMDMGHFADSDISIADGWWHHIAATYDGEIQRLYVDGEPQSRPSEWKGKVLSTKVGLTIGNCMTPKFEEAFRGAIGELMIYSRSLSAEEISLLYNSQKEKYL